jgi:DNA polymerase delta subunit 1
MEIVSIEEIESIVDDYVYDIETEEGTYLAGDDILVKNTDSCYVKFDVDKAKFVNDQQQFDEKAFMREQFRLATECAARITKEFKKPINLEFEKIMYPFFLYEKKRYAYMEWLNPEGPEEELEYKGIATVRRDYCPFVKEVCNNIFNILMKEKSESPIESAIIYTRKSIEDLFNNRVPIEKLVISKSLKNTYKCDGIDIAWYNVLCKHHRCEKEEGTLCKKCDTCKEFGKECQLCKKSIDFVKSPHVYIARKLKKKDPINGPKPPDRVPYVFVKTNTVATGQCYRTKSPSEIEASMIDSVYYFDHQLKEPVMQIFSLMVPDTTAIYENLLLAKINKDKGQSQLFKFSNAPMTITSSSNSTSNSTSTITNNAHFQKKITSFFKKKEEVMVEKEEEVVEKEESDDDE